MKIVINRTYGGFGLSKGAFIGYCQAMELDPEGSFDGDIERTCPTLIAIIESMGEVDASGPHAKLQIVDVPAGTEFVIEEYDGLEWIKDKGSFDWRVAT